MRRPKRPALLLPVLASALLAVACRSPVPLTPAPAAQPVRPAATPGPPPAPDVQLALPAAPEPAAAATAPLPEAEPTAPPEELAEDPELVMVRAVLAVRAGRMAKPARERLAAALVEAEREWGLPALLMVALIDQESRFRPRARGPRGALGLMQIRPFVGEEVAARIGVPWQGERTLLDPVLNVRIGAAYLAELQERFGSPELALAAYNMGPTRLARRLSRGDARRPAFVSRVLRNYDGLQRDFQASETGIGG